MVNALAARRRAPDRPEELPLTDLPLIKDIHFTPVVVPYETPLRTASGTMPGAAVGIIEVPTSAGVTGTAYMTAYTPRMLRALEDLCADIKDLAVGKPVDPEARQAEFEAAFRLLGVHGLLAMLLGGIDMALWDGVARFQGLSVCALLGAEPGPVRSYDSFGLIDPKTDGGRLQRSLKRGFSGIKIKAGAGSLADDVAACRFVRGEIGPDVALMVDFNQALDVEDALARAATLAEFDLTWIEEPVQAEDLSGHRAVKKGGPIKVQTGQNWCFPAAAANAMAFGASDYVMPDLMKIGGVTGWKKVARMAEAHGLPLSSHTFVEASAHVLPATPTAHWHEYLDKVSALLVEPYEVVQGSVTARGPGFGMEWNRAHVDDYRL